MEPEVSPSNNESSLGMETRPQLKDLNKRKDRAKTDKMKGETSCKEKCCHSTVLKRPRTKIAPAPNGLELESRSVCMESSSVGPF